MLNKLLQGYTNIEFPSININNANTFPNISINEPEENSILFITDKISEEEKIFDFTKSPATPIVAIVSQTKRVLSPPCPIIRVDNVREALSYAVSNSCKINYEKIKFIGVTGTNGKTTTGSLIYEMLRISGYKVGFIGTGKIISNGVNLAEETYSMTTPDPTLLYPSIKQMSEDGCEFIVMEISSHSIALGKIAPINFEYAIFTNLDNDHLDFHGSKEEYFKTKLKLFSSAKQGLFNLDDHYSKLASESVDCKVSTFGIINDADAYATEIDTKELTNSNFFYRSSNLIFKANTNLGGAFNIYNSLAALKCVIDLGIKPCIAKQAIEKINLIEGRMQVIDGDIRAVIDYAHTPAAFYNSLKTLKQAITIKQNLIVVFGCGGNRDKTKRPLFGKYADMFADKIIITEDNSRNESFDIISSNIIEGIKTKEYEIIPDREKAIHRAFEVAKSNDLIAIIGKGHERYKIIKDEYIPFDERKIIIDAMKKRAAHICE